jgi:hypothetical protein
MVHHRRRNKTQRGIRKKLLPSDSLADPLNDTDENRTLRNVDEHPIENGNYLIVRYRDNSQRIAKVIKKWPIIVLSISLGH